MGEGTPDQEASLMCADARKRRKERAREKDAQEEARVLVYLRHPHIEEIERCKSVHSYSTIEVE